MIMITLLKCKLLQQSTCTPLNQEELKLYIFVFLSCLLLISLQNSQLPYILSESKSLWLWSLVFMYLTCLNHENETVQPITKVTCFLEACIKILLFKINQALIVCPVSKDVALYCICHQERSVSFFRFVYSNKTLCSHRLNYVNIYNN